MATKWFKDRDLHNSKREQNRCEKCRAGYHGERGCIGRACTCFCRLPGVAPLTPASPMVLRPSTGGVLTKMREAGVECRGTRMWTLVFRPKPADLEPALRMAIRNYMPDLVRVLFPSLEVGRPQHRPYWFVDGVGECFDCTQSVALCDPLGQRRHTWCGWLSAPPANQYTLDLTKGK